MFTVPARSRRATAAPAMATDQLTPCGHPSRSSSCGSSRADTDRQRSGGDLRASCFSQVRLVPTYVAVSGGQTRREAGTLSHGTHEVSRVAEGEIPMINTTTTAPSGSAPMARTTSPWARLTTVTWARARGPLGILEGTRWLFLGLALLSLALTVPVPLVEARGAGDGVILVSSAALVASWLVGYRQRRAPLVTDLLDGAAVFGFAVACAVPSAVFGLLLSALWFRSLYGSIRSAVLRCVLYAFALIGAIATWPHVFGRTEPTAVAHVLTSIPIMFLTVVVGRRLAASLVARERGQAIGIVYAVPAYELIG